MSGNQTFSRQMTRMLLGALVGALIASLVFLILFAVEVATDSPMIGKGGFVLAAVVLPLVCVTCGVIIARRKSNRGAGPGN